jgi:hypothetical protein
MGVNSGLYALDERLLALEEKINSQGGEVLPEDEEAFASLEMDSRELADQLVRWRQNTKLEAEALAEQAKVFDREASRLRGVARIKDGSSEYAQEKFIALMAKMGMKKLKTSLGTASVCETPKPKIVAPKGELIPEGFRKQKVEWELDRDAVLEADEQGCLPDEIKVVRSQYIRLSATKEEKIHAD